MGIMDKVRGLLRGRERQVKRGIDTVSNKAERAVPKHARTIDAASDKAKEAVDKVAGSGGRDATPSTQPAVSEPPASQPPEDPPAG